MILESFYRVNILKLNTLIKNGCQVFYQEQLSDLLASKACRSRIPRTGSILYVEFSLTQTADKVSHRSNSFLFHYPYGLGADDGNVRFAL